MFLYQIILTGTFASDLVHDVASYYFAMYGRAGLTIKSYSLGRDT